MFFPILWRYVVGAYLKVFFLSVSTFVSVLIVSRFKDIARFAALSANWPKTGLYVLYQIPFILPMAIPLSAFIASFLVFQRLSRTQELTAFRALGLSFRNILIPLLMMSGFFTILNFSIVAELSPFCRLESNALLYRETSDNPLLLLQRQNLIKIRNTYLRMSAREDGSRVRNFLFITYNEANQRLNLLSANKMKIEGEELMGQDVAILSHLFSDAGQFDPLILENQKTVRTEAALLSDSLKKNRPKIDNASLTLRMLKHKLHEKPKQRRSALVEVIRRTSLAFSVLTFTFVGCAFGIEQGRNPKKWPLLYALLISLSVLASYFLGKNFKAAPLMALLVYLIPHLLAWFFSLLRILRLSRGAA